MDHLDEVASSCRSHVAETLVFRGSQGLEDGFQPFKHILLPANHQGVTFNQPPDAAAGAHVHEVDTVLSQFLRPPHTVLVVGVATVKNGIPSRQQRYEAVYSVLGRLADGQHHPDSLGGGQIFDKFFDGRHPNRSLGLTSGDRLGTPVVGHDAMPTVQQALHHIPAHAAQANHANLHNVPLSDNLD